MYFNSDIVPAEENESEDDDELIGLIGQAKYKPVLMTETKFAANAFKFLKNYLKNLPHYVLGFNNRLNDAKIPAKNVSFIEVCWSKLTFIMLQ